MSTVVNFSTPGRSRYGAIADNLRAEITSGRWAAGELLPAETALMGEYGVALGTIRQAISVLVEEGLVERRHGTGTFVRTGLTGASLLRFFRFGRRDQGGYETPKSHIHQRVLVSAPPELAAQLELKVGARVIHIMRTRSIAGKACLLENIWVDAKRFGALTKGSPHAWGDLLYPEYSARCGVIVHRATDSIQFGLLSDSDASLLSLPPQHPAVVVARVAYDLAGKPVEVRVTRGDANAFHYSVELR